MQAIEKVTPGRVWSCILGQELELAIPYGRPEKSFLGNGRVGAGGTVEGIWDYLIGPNYSSPDFIKSETLYLEGGGIETQGKPLVFSMQRLCRSGILFSSITVGPVSVELIEWAPWEGCDVVRLVQVTNRGQGTVKGVTLSAAIDVIGHPEFKGQSLYIAQPEGALSYGRECKNWMNRRAEVRWNLAGGVRHVGDCCYRLWVDSCDLEPGASFRATLIHRVQETGRATPVDIERDWTQQLNQELQAWRDWYAQGDERCLSKSTWGGRVESQLAFMRMQQSEDGGFIAGVRRYAHSYVRDMHGAARGMLASGHLNEVWREMEWIDRKYRAFKVIVNASEMGVDRRDFGAHGNFKGTELEAYYLLMARGYLRHGGEYGKIEPFKESLLAAARVQMQTSREQGWRFRYNGDETERYVPVKDGDTYGCGKADWQDRAEWSMPSHVLAMASTDFVVRDLVPHWGIDPAPFADAIENWRASFKATFMPGGRRIPAWVVFTDGTLPTYPVPSYLCFPAWVDAPFSMEEKREWAQEAYRHLNAKGILPVSPGEVEGSTGHALGKLLYALKVTAAGPEQIKRVEDSILTGGQFQWFGLVNEFYGPNNVPNPHNLRPFETGILMDALLL